MYSAWAALGLAAQGTDPLDIRRGGRSLFDYVSAGTGPSSDPGSLERTILVLRSSGSSARSDLVAALARHFGGNGSISNQVNLTAFGILALRAAGEGIPGAGASWLLRQQNPDGGFSFATAGAPSDVDDTAAALEALAGVGGSADASRARAVAYIRGQQNRDGGLPEQGGGDSNAQSTAWAVQGLLAAGTSPGSLHRAGAPSPLAYLGSLIAPDGHVRYSRGTDQTPVWVTGEAAMALAGKPLPLAPLALPRAGSGHSAPPVRPGDRRPGSTAGGSPAAVSRSGAVHPRNGHVRARAARPPVPVPAGLQALAGDAGVATAILLAPMGLG
jgi:energy-coupling factor transport system substrate-specific component